MTIQFSHGRRILCAKLFLLLTVAVASSQLTTGFDSRPTRSRSLLREHTIPSLALLNVRRYGRKPAEAPRPPALDDDDDVDDDNDDDLHLDRPPKDFRLAGKDLDGLDLEREDKEDAALMKKTKDLLDGNKAEKANDANDADDADDDKPLTFKELGRITKDLDLSDEDLKDLDDIESGKISMKNVGSRYKRNPDERPRDVPPPPGMVANPHDMKKITRDIDLRQGLELDNPPAPQEPSDITVKSVKVNANDSASRLAQENAEYEDRVLTLTRKLEDARREIRESKLDADEAESMISQLKEQQDRSKDAFQRSLESAREEDKSEKEEMADTIKEQKRAFDELFEEKQLLSQMLSDEQKTLKELQEKIQHPDLGLWVRQRAERAAILVETPETDAVKYYAKKYMAPKVTKMRHRLELLEKRVERTVDHLLPAKYGSVVALLLTICLVGFPIMVTMSTVMSVTKSVSLRQYVLLGNVFLTAFTAGLCVAGILLRQDPLQTLYEASETLFITLQLMTAVVFPLFLGVIGCTVLRSRDRLDAFVFGCEFVFYALVAMNYRSRVWRPAMLGQNIETSVMMYAIYLMDFMSMTALTISSSRIEEAGMIGDTDPEAGLGKKAGISGNGALNGSLSSRVSSLSSGLIQAAMGHGRTGKEE